MRIMKGDQDRCMFNLTIEEKEVFRQVAKKKRTTMNGLLRMVILELSEKHNLPLSL